jgi:hypothetical protein
MGNLLDELNQTTVKELIRTKYPASCLLSSSRLLHDIATVPIVPIVGLENNQLLGQILYSDYLKFTRYLSHLI